MGATASATRLASARVSKVSNPAWAATGTSTGPISPKGLTATSTTDCVDSDTGEDSLSWVATSRDRCVSTHDSWELDAGIAAETDSDCDCDAVADADADADADVDADADTDARVGSLTEDAG